MLQASSRLESLKLLDGVGILLGPTMAASAVRQLRAHDIPSRALFSDFARLQGQHLTCLEFVWKSRQEIDVERLS